eukprot:101009-Chlamydomonas_euryale.AAC.4
MQQYACAWAVLEALTNSGRGSSWIPSRVASLVTRKSRGEAAMRTWCVSSTAAGPMVNGRGAQGVCGRHGQRRHASVVQLLLDRASTGVDHRAQGHPRVGSAARIGLPQVQPPVLLFRGR